MSLRFSLPFLLLVRQAYLQLQTISPHARLCEGNKAHYQPWIALSDGTRWKKISDKILLVRLSVEVPRMNISLIPINNNKNRNHVRQQWLAHLLAQFSAKYSFVKHCLVAV